MPDTSSVYRPRKPQDSQYYQCVGDHFETFEQVYDERFAKQYGFFRPYVKQVIYRYLDCGILHNGFARVKCGECGHEYLLAFSCKRRHFCPSCHQKRVVEFGEWLGETGKHLQGLDGIEIIDLSELALRSYSGHLYHLYNDDINADLGLLLNEQRPAGKRPHLTEVVEGYWHLSPVMQ